MQRNPLFSEILAFAPHASAEDNTWRRKLVSVSSTPARRPTVKTNSPPILPDFASVTLGKRPVLRDVFEAAIFDFNLYGGGAFFFCA